MTYPDRWPKPTERARARRRAPPLEKQCVACGAPFVCCTRGHSRIYCTRHCYLAARDRRRRPYKAEHARLWRIRETARRAQELEDVIQRKGTGSSVG